MEEFIYLAREARAKILPYVYERGWDLLMYKDSPNITLGYFTFKFN